MAKHVRDNSSAADDRNVQDKRSALAGASGSRSVQDKRSALAGAAGSRNAAGGRNAAAGRNAANSRNAADSHNVQDKRSALAGASMQPRAYSHSDQVGGTKRREADGRWVDREPEPAGSSKQRSAQQRAAAQQRGPQRETPVQFVLRNAVYILSVVAVVVIAVMLVFGVRMFSEITAPLQVIDPEQYESPYDWSNLQDNEGRLAYVVDGQVKSRLGIDVADYQGDIDWDAVASDGIDFAIIRLGYRGATEGELYVDDYYSQNIAGAKAAGIDCGVYFFSQAITEEEAIEEAEFVLEYLDGMSLEYPVAFDSEVVPALGATRTSGLSREEMTAIATAFCNRIEQAGYRTLVYGNSGDLRSYSIDYLSGKNIWWAEYGSAYPSHYLDIAIWQYDNDSWVDGISNGVDMNIDLSGIL